MTRTNALVLAAVAAALGTCASAQATVITDWDFGSITSAATPDNTPAPTTGSGSATSLGMTNSYTYPENQSGSGGPVTGATTYDDITSDSPASSVGNGNVWRIRGNPNSGGNGWNNSAPEYSQGAEFNVSTVGYSNVSLSFTWASTNQGIANMQVLYTTNGGSTWTSIGSLLTATIDSGSNSYQTDTINFTGISGVANDPNFGVELVSAYNPTLGSEYASATSVASGSPKQYDDDTGNWRFADVQLDGTASPVPLPAAAWLLMSGLGGLGALARRRKTV